MYYAALVRDKNPIANSRVISAYVTPTPTAFFDGGYGVVMGGGVNLVPYYEPVINTTAQREVPPIDLITAIDWLGDYRVRVHVAVGNGVAANTPPAVPSQPFGPDRTVAGNVTFYEAGTTDPEGNMLYYQWDWGDGEVSDWIGPYNSAATMTALHTWAADGSYQVRIKARDPFGEETDWSAAASIVVNCCSGRVGDANSASGDEPTIGDVGVLIDAKFISGSCEAVISCLAEADVNQSGGSSPSCGDITISDISILIDYLFITGSSVGLPDCL